MQCLKKLTCIPYCMCVTFPEVPTMGYNDLNVNACSLIG